jgi:pyruvate,water dikinase
MTIYIRFLEELNKDSLPQAGGKGANLGVLINAQLPVPPGFTIITEAYRAHLDSSGLRDKISQRLKNVNAQDLESVTIASHEISTWIEEAPMPEEIKDEIVNAYIKLAGRMAASDTGAARLQVAVRSSATAEDLPSASFAGQQETFLGVYGTEALLQHTKKCWASLWTSQAISYRSSMNFEHLKVELAVVVQVMLSADAAGVMFTANPVSSSREEILISASYGLGETVVSGSVTPDTFIVSKKGGIKQRVLGTKEHRILLVEGGIKTEQVPPVDRGKYCLTDANIAELVSLANRVQAHYGSPQDTEWALAKGKIYLLQARPITTMDPVNGNNPESQELLWTRRGEPSMIQDVMEHSPEPLTPLDMAVFCIGDRAFQKAALTGIMGLSAPKKFTEPVERSNGMVGVRLEQASFSPLMFWRMPSTLISRAFKDPQDIWKPVNNGIKSYLEKMDSMEKKVKDAPGMARLVQHAIAEFEPLMEQRFSAVFMTSIVNEMLVSYFIRKAVGKESADEIKSRVLRALPFRTALQNQAIVKLARIAVSSGEESIKFQDALKGFLEEYGSRPARGMIIMPSISTLREEPKVVLGLVRALLDDPASLDWEESMRTQEADYLDARSKVENALGQRARGWFRTNLERVRNGEVVREESLFMIEKMIAYIRHASLRLGELLVEKSFLEKPDDVFFLFMSELQSVADGTLDVQKLVNKRKQAFARVYASHERGQHWMIATGSIPQPKQKTNKKSRSSKLGNGFSYAGMSASRGEVEGTVCVVRDRKSSANFVKVIY